MPRHLGNWAYRGLAHAVELIISMSHFCRRLFLSRFCVLNVTFIIIWTSLHLWAKPWSWSAKNAGCCFPVDEVGERAEWRRSGVVDGERWWAVERDWRLRVWLGGYRPDVSTTVTRTTSCPPALAVSAPIDLSTDRASLYWWRPPPSSVVYSWRLERRAARLICTVLIASCIQMYRSASA